MKYTILIPIYNDRESLKILIEKINSEIKSLNSEISIVVVNDASSQQIIDTYPNIENIKSLEIINMKENKGHTRCIASGLKYLWDKKEFDFVIISDVLHHIGIEKKNEIRNLLNKLSQSCNFVLIKDHFEYGPFSRAILRFMDFIGNYKDDVSIPKIYFNEKELNSLMDEIKLIKVKELKNISLYRKIFFPFNLKKFQFIHLYKRQ